ncbi:hypothetical protein StoSoilB20_10910 [Arthrobacter sp. StoSoilB20]|nr:hypothetical protein StoSoilB20_10910 [Arthrobacter sp. StoSoilB20]
MLSHSAKSPENHRPNELKRDVWVFVELTTSQNKGSSAYTAMTPIRMVSRTELRFRVTPWRRVFNLGAGDRRGLAAGVGLGEVSLEWAGLKRTDMG